MVRVFRSSSMIRVSAEPGAAARVAALARITVLRRLQEYHLVIVAVFAVVLLAFGTAFSVVSHDDRLRQDARLRSIAETQKSLDSVKIIRPPSRLFFLRDHGGARLPPFLIVTPDFVDYPIVPQGDTSFLDGRFSLDWTFVIGHLFGLLALLSTCDLISGDKENGTLRLLCSHPMARWELLWGSYLGALLSLLGVLLFGCLLGVTVLVWKDVVLDPSDWLRVVAFAGLSTFFVATMAAIGLTISCSFRRRGASILCAVLIWTVVGVLLPRLGDLVGLLIAPVPSNREFDSELFRARARFSSQLTISSMMLSAIHTRDDLSEAEKHEAVARLQESLVREHEARLSEYKREVVRVRERYIGRLEAQAGVSAGCARLSPISAYTEAAESIAVSGRAGLRHFYHAAVEYMGAYSRYARYWRERLRSQASISGPTVIDGPYRIQGVGWVSYAKVPVDDGSFPRFEEHGTSATDDLWSAWQSIMSLAAWAIVPLLVAQLRFGRYDPR